MGGHRRAFDARERLEARVRLLGVLCMASVGVSLSQAVLIAVWWVTR